MIPTRLVATAVVAALAAPVGVLLAPAAVAAPPSLEETRTFTVPDPRATGYGLDLDGDLAVYTGRYDSRGAAGTGLVQVARRTGPAATDWTTTDLPVPAEVRGYGVSVAVDADAGRVVVGAITSQHVVVYTRTGPDEWAVDRVLEAPADPRVGLVRTFGETVALDGGTLVVGAPNSTVDGRANAGLAYLFDLDAGTSRPLLPAPELVVGDSIAGQAVDVADGRVAVGAPQLRRTLDFYGGQFRVGGVYLWDTAALDAGPSLTSQPVGEEMRSVPPGNGGGPAFGYALALAGGRLYVGSPLEVNYTAEDPADPVGGYNVSSIDSGTTTQGAVYVYDPSDAAAPARVGGKLMPPAHSYGFGYRVDATTDALLASAYSAADGLRGEVHVLDPAAVDPTAPDDGGLLRQTVEPVQTLRGSDMEPGARFGSSDIGGGVAVSGGRALVAAFATGASASGKVYLFDAVVPEPVEVAVPDVTVTYGLPATLTATVSGLVPAGASVAVDGVELGGVTSDGATVTASVAAAAYDVGDHEVAVAVRREAGGEVVATATALLRVLPAATTTTVDPGPGASRPAGEALPVTGTVAGEHGTVPGGSVELLAAGEVVATADLGADGSYATEVPAPAVVPGELALEARYAGDTNHLASSASASVQVRASDPPIPTPEPTEPVEPVDPVDPVDPVEPVDPVDPPAPADPAGEAAPSGPASAVLAVTGPGGLAALLAAAVLVIALGVVLVRRRRA